MGWIVVYIKELEMNKAKFFNTQSEMSNVSTVVATGHFLFPKTVKFIELWKTQLR